MWSSEGRNEIAHAWDAIDDPYDRLHYIANHLVSKTPEATFYDLFNLIRTDVFNGLEYDEESYFIRNIDSEIDREIKYSLKRR